MERIKKEGHSELLVEFASIVKYQQYCEMLMRSHADSAYCSWCYRGVKWCYDGIVETSSSVVIQVSAEIIVEADIETHQLVKVNNIRVDCITHNALIDLSEGNAWHGDGVDDQPFGWGVLYDSEGEKKYEGFRIGEANVCYGIQYYPDIQKVEYEGEWCDGKRWGRGIQYDRNGCTVFDGVWMDDEPVIKRMVLNEENQLLHNHIEELTVSNGSCNGSEWIVLDLSFIPSLRELKVGDSCFECVKRVKLIGLKRLERVVIGNNSFSLNCYGNDPNRHFYLKNCERVRELKVGRYSFADYSVCEIESVPSLEVIEMGDLNGDGCNFFYASLELKSDSQRMN